MLELNLLGTAQARYFDHSLEGFPNQQPYLLLCYLLLNRQRSHCRERLAAVFWSEYPTQTSLKYLRNAIWRVRKTLQSVGAPPDEYVVVNNGTISFGQASSYWLDVEAFETKVSPCQDVAGQHLTTEQATRLEEAVELYAGDLLEGVYEDWCLYDRERLSLMYLNTLSKLMTYHEFNATYERGLACGERILAIDDTREKVHRHMMRLYLLTGNRYAAMEQYKRCAQILRETLGVPPMEATTQLYQQIVHNQFHDDRPAHRPIPPSLPLEPEEPRQALAQYALRRVHNLQSTIEEATAELNHIEHFLRETMLPPHGP